MGEYFQLLRRDLTPRPTVGSGYRPSAWCKACGMPYDIGLPRCPEEGCGQPQAPVIGPVGRVECACTQYGRTQPLLTCRDCGGTGVVGS